jgi:hypothetical protein
MEDELRNLRAQEVVIWTRDLDIIKEPVTWIELHIELLSSVPRWVFFFQYVLLDPYLVKKPRLGQHWLEHL